MMVNPANYILLSSKPASKLARAADCQRGEMQSHSVYTTHVTAECLSASFAISISPACGIAFQEVLGLRIFLGGAVEVLIEPDSWATAPIPRLYPGIPFIYTTLDIHHTFTHAVYIIHFGLLSNSPKIWTCF